MNYLEMQSLLALANLVICGCIAWACVCRLHRMSAASTRKDVRAAVAFVMTAAVVSGLSPLLWREWPGFAQVLLTLAFFVLLVVGAREWRDGLPKYARSDHAPLDPHTTQF